MACNFIRCWSFFERLYFIYALHLGILQLEPWERYLVNILVYPFFLCLSTLCIYVNEYIQGVYYYYLSVYVAAELRFTLMSVKRYIFFEEGIPLCIFGDVLFRFY